MDIKEYIASGILENYVFGHVSAQEMQEVECMSHIYPEIKEELTSIQLTIEKVAEKYATPPPTALKTKLFAQLKTEPQIQPAVDEKETKIIPLSQPASSTTLSKWYAAAGIILLIGLGAYAFLINGDLNQSRAEFAATNDSLNALKGDVNSLNDENSVITEQLALFSDQMNFIRDENTSKINLTGTANYTDNLATVFWNNTTEKVMLDIKNLPATQADESYQLWVLVDGVPQDMGVFDFEINSAAPRLLQMNSTKNADAFAITREPKGGSVSPTLENLHVIGMI